VLSDLVHTKSYCYQIEKLDGGILMMSQLLDASNTSPAVPSKSSCSLIKVLGTGIDRTHAFLLQVINILYKVSFQPNHYFE
jgi:hypothetical protein